MKTQENKSKVEKMTFGTIVCDLRLESYIKSLSEYNTSLTSVLSSNHKLPLFLDTNVLLRYYETSLKYRDRLYKYFGEKLKQIVLTNEIQKEFIRNRENTIERFVSNSLNNFKTEFESKFIKGFNSYLDSIKIHLDDFPEIGTSINEIQGKAKETYDALSKKIEDNKIKLKELKQKDDYLNLFLNVQLLDQLADDDIKLLKEEFDSLGKQLDDAKKDMENRTASIFPGYLDKKRKGKNPYGDYIIFHEILNYMKTNSTNAVLLTYDAKGDWIKENREAHSHYIQIAYEATGFHLIIVEAEQYFQNKLQMNFAPIVNPESDPEIKEMTLNTTVLLSNLDNQLSNFIKNIGSLVELSKNPNIQKKSFADKINELAKINFLHPKLHEYCIISTRILDESMLEIDKFESLGIDYLQILLYTNQQLQDMIAKIRVDLF